MYRGRDLQAEIFALECQAKFERVHAIAANGGADTAQNVNFAAS